MAGVSLTLCAENTTSKILFHGKPQRLTNTSINPICRHSTICIRQNTLQIIFENEAMRHNLMKPIQQLEASGLAAAETYANVHRGSGHFSLATTALYEHARQMVLDDLGLSARSHVLIFCSPAQARQMQAVLNPHDWACISSKDLHLPFGLCALAVRKRALPGGAPLQPGGGTVKMVSLDSVVWAAPPDKFETGTPPILHAILLARALQISREAGKNCFLPGQEQIATAQEILFDDPLLSLRGMQLWQKLQNTQPGKALSVPTNCGERGFIQLDNAASTPTFLPIWQAARRTWQASPAIQSGVVNIVKDICARFFHAPSDQYEIIFTTNTSEAINLAARLLGESCPQRGRTTVFSTLLEHHSNDLPWRYQPGIDFFRLPVDSEGFLDLDILENHLRQPSSGEAGVRLVALCGASNVLGTFNDLAAIAERVHRHGALLLVDAAQLAAHRPIDASAMRIDCLAFSGHKMYAPFGSGGLILRKGLIPPSHALKEAAQSGEENTAGIAALGKSMLLLETIGLDLIAAEEENLTRQILQAFQAEPRLKLYGVSAPGSPKIARRGTVFSFEVDNIPYNLVAHLLAWQGGIGVRTGCFCAHPIVKHLLHIHPFRQRVADIAVQVFPRIAMQIVPGMVRVSFGLENTEADARYLIQVLNSILANTKSTAFEKFLSSTHNGTPWIPPFKAEEFISVRIEKVFPHT